MFHIILLTTPDWHCFLIDLKTSSIEFPISSVSLMDSSVHKMNLLTISITLNEFWVLFKHHSDGSCILFKLSQSGCAKVKFPNLFEYSSSIPLSM